ncbi:diguanylate cyclase (GGDEF domain) [hydrothermal vent metagenome]|uniref:Diguanylate cyclase (GGDEF domain) n=1 Tax=hydrothermal vent metagenome TaxID=652676 RepID=A0A3B0VYX9_9ZZZZ
MLSAGPMLIIPLMVVLISFIVINAESEKMESSLSHMEQNNIDLVKSTILSRVNSIVDLAEYRKSVIKSDLHNRIQQRVEDAHKIATALHQRYGSIKPEEEVRSLIIEALRPLTWNEGESFIWILDFDGVFQLAPEYLTSLEGTSILDFKDATGREVIKEEIALTRSGGQGFLWDTFTRPNTGTDEQFEQLAFVKSLGFYNWYMGSAEFLDIAMKQTDKSLLAEINQLSMAGKHYFFIMNKQGTLLLNSARPEWVGLSYQDSDDVAIRELYQKIVSAVNSRQSNAFIEYQWLNPNTGEVEVKYSYVKSVPNSEWIIGSGFYPEDIVRALQPQIIESTKLNQQKLDQLLKIAFWSFIASILIAILLSWAVYCLLWRSRNEVDDKNRALRELNSQLERKVLKRTEALTEMNDELEVLARTDCLTGVDNRFSFMKIVEAEERRCKRFKDTFSLILLDVDNFKQINDQYGHDVGDLVLIGLAKITKEYLREVDTLCRFGGEEFIIVLPKTDLETACKTAERLCLEMAQHPFPQVEKVTISLGVGSYQPDLTIDELIKKVDVALYQAKRSGKNKVCCADE